MIHAFRESRRMTARPTVIIGVACATHVAHMSSGLPPLRGYQSVAMYLVSV